MTFYFICYIILALSLALGLMFDKLRVAAIFAFIPMFILIISRGLVGIDSAVYVQEFDVIYYNGFLASGFEPGFALLVELMSPLFSSSFDVLVLLGGVTAVLMLVAGLRLEHSPILFLTIILSFFMIDMTINGLRFGLAFAIVALGAAELTRGKLTTFIICGVIAASIQVSSALLTIGLWALLEVRVRTFLGVAAGSLLMLVLFGNYLEGKISDNSEVYGLGGLSGIAPLISTILMVFAVQISDKKIADARIALYAILTMQLISFALARYYYAGLRLQSLFFFLLYLYLAASIRRADFNISKARLANALFAVTMLISSASRLNNFEENTEGPSPFNPYYFNKELVF